MNRTRLLLLPLMLAACGPGAGGPKTGPGGSSPSARLVMELGHGADPEKAEASPVLSALKHERDRYMQTFGKLPEPRPYFLSYIVRDQHEVEVTATLGALVSADSARRRTLGVEVRVGDYKVDNTNPIGDGGYGFFGSWLLPIEDDPKALEPTLWLATEKQFRRAREDYAKIRTNIAIKAKVEDGSDDFSREQPVVQISPLANAQVDLEQWKTRVRGYSALFREHPEILRSAVQLQLNQMNRYMVNSEGSEVQDGRVLARISFFAATRTEDGMDLLRHDAVDAGSLEKLASDDEVRRRIQSVIQDIKALRKAPMADPYVGPAILEGRAAGVYFHEIFGHRVEGHRQKSQEEGQTFAKKVGKPVLPDFIDVFDDPTVTTLNGLELNGHYLVDDEAVRSQRANLVEGGVLRGFLMSRSPARGFNRSSGHGRAQDGRPPVSRQGNLIVRPTKVTTPEELKRGLLAEVKRQGKPYGLRFTLVDGGFTNTSRYGAQFFKVQPVMVYKVYPDGKEELVRGADIEGTPLTSISQIVMSANDVTVFNGYCGAESGMVPVSAASPSLLVSKVEIARKASGKEKPPILPPPAVSTKPAELGKGGAS